MRKKKFLPVILAAIVAIAYFVLNPGQAGDKDIVDDNQDQTSVDDAVVSGGEPGDTLYKVIRVVDGDTIIIDYNGAEERVRMIGVDTPESVHPDESRNTDYGIIASDFTKEQLTGKSVALELDVEERDKYDRLLAYVYLDGEMFNGILVRQGYAMSYTYPPNVKYVDLFTQLQKEARADNLGLWAEFADSGNYVGSLKGDKYHLITCTGGQSIKEENKIWFETADEAVAMGYSPCSQCL